MNLKYDSGRQRIHLYELSTLPVLVERSHENSPVSTPSPTAGSPRSNESDGSPQEIGSPFDSLNDSGITADMTLGLDSPRSKRVSEFKGISFEAPVVNLLSKTKCSSQNTDSVEANCLQRPHTSPRFYGTHSTVSPRCNESPEVGSASRRSASAIGSIFPDSTRSPTSINSSGKSSGSALIKVSSFELGDSLDDSGISVSPITRKGHPAYARIKELTERNKVLEEENKNLHSEMKNKIKYIQDLQERYDDCIDTIVSLNDENRELRNGSTYTTNNKQQPSVSVQSVKLKEQEITDLKCEIKELEYQGKMWQIRANLLDVDNDHLQSQMKELQHVLVELKKGHDVEWEPQKYPPKIQTPSHIRSKPTNLKFGPKDLHKQSELDGRLHSEFVLKDEPILHAVDLPDLNSCKPHRQGFIGSKRSVHNPIRSHVSKDVRFDNLHVPHSHQNLSHAANVAFPLRATHIYMPPITPAATYHCIPPPPSSPDTTVPHQHPSSYQHPPSYQHPKIYPHPPHSTYPSPSTYLPHPPNKPKNNPRRKFRL